MLTHIITETGFEVDIDIELMDDMELFDLIVELDEGNLGKIPKLLKKVLNKEDIKRLYDHVRLEGGRVPATSVVLELGNIMNAFNEVDGKKK